MSKHILTASEASTPPFKFKGDCYLCVKGSGSFTVERQMSDTEGFEVVTDAEGVPLEFVGDGVLFNSVITCSRSMYHRIVAKTTTEIHVSSSAGTYHEGKSEQHKPRASA